MTISLAPPATDNQKARSRQPRCAPAFLGSAMMLATAVTACGDEQPAPASSEQDVIDGQIAKDPAFDAIGALLRISNDPEEAPKPFCTGTLIAPDTVLTALHCVSGKLAAEVLFGFGWDGYAPWHTVAVTKFRYGSDALAVGLELSTAGDVALLILAEPVDKMPPIAAAQLTPEHIGQEFTVIGYGYDTRDLEQFGIRRTGTSTLMLLEDDYVAKVGDWETDVDDAVCMGDSGGPLIGVVDGTLLTFGVTSKTSAGTQMCDNPATYQRFGPRHCDSGTEVGNLGCDGTQMVSCENGGAVEGPNLDYVLDCAELNPPMICDPEATGFACVAGEQGA